MKVYIQSKSGNFNTELDYPNVDSLAAVFVYIKEDGYYMADYRERLVLVPFEEIEYISEERTDD